MSALTDIQRALNIIRKVVDAQHKNIGLDALVLLNQTAASLNTLLKDKPRAVSSRVCKERRQEQDTRSIQWMSCAR